jgi:hypothetical protein
MVGPGSGQPALLCTSADLWHPTRNLSFIFKRICISFGSKYFESNKYIFLYPWITLPFFPYLHWKFNTEWLQEKLSSGMCRFGARIFLPPAGDIGRVPYERPHRGLPAAAPVALQRPPGLPDDHLLHGPHCARHLQHPLLYEVLQHQNIFMDEGND